MICWLASTLPADGQDHEREAIMAIDASLPYVPAIRETLTLHLTPVHRHPVLDI